MAKITKKISDLLRLATATQSGLVKGGTVPGSTSGGSTSSGYIGEKITWTAPPSDQNLTTTETDWTNANITLPAGVWFVVFNVTARYSTGGSAGDYGNAYVKVTNSSNTLVQSKEISIQSGASGISRIVAPISGSFLVNLSGSTTYKMRVVMAHGQGTGTGTVYNSSSTSEFYAIRIG